MKTLSSRVAARVNRINPPATVVVSDKVRELKRRGVDIVDLGGGEPDFDTPAHIVEAAARAMREGFTHYVASRGIPELLEAIAMKLERDNGLTYDPDTEILVTPSGKNAIFSTLLATVDDGDEVIIVEPAWVSYADIVKLAGGTPVAAPCYADEDFVIKKERLKAALSPRSRILMVCSPSNPTGHVFARDELQVLADFAIKNDLLVIADEMYEQILYPPHRHTSLAALPGMKERTVTQNGFSKAYAMTGWRLGYLACDGGLLKQILKIHSQSVTCAASFAQKAAVAALTGPQDVVTEMVRRYAERRMLIAEGLNGIDGISDRPVDGAFYAFPDIRGTGMSSMKMATFLLEKAHVAGTPGVAFGACGEGHVRFSFANSDDLIKRAIDQIGQALRQR